MLRAVLYRLKQIGPEESAREWTTWDFDESELRALLGPEAGWQLAGVELLPPRAGLGPGGGE